MEAEDLADAEDLVEDLVEPEAMATEFLADGVVLAEELMGADILVDPLALLPLELAPCFDTK